MLAESAQPLLSPLGQTKRKSAAALVDRLNFPFARFLSQLSPVFLSLLPRRSVLLFRPDSLSSRSQLACRWPVKRPVRKLW